MSYTHGRTHTARLRHQVHLLSQANQHLQDRAEAAEDRVAEVERALRAIAEPGTALARVLASHYDGEEHPMSRREVIDAEVTAHHENQRTLRNADALH